jgi:gas vesicle protein
LRTAIIGIGAFVVGLLLGAIVGIVAGTIAAPEQASSPRTVTETRYVTVVQPQEASASASTSASASASAALSEQGAKPEGSFCKMGS